MSAIHAPINALNEALEVSLRADGPAIEGRVAVAVGDHRYLVNTQALEEVGTVPPISRLGMMPTAVVGLANFRGVPRTLMDAPALLGLGHLEDPANSWALLLKSDDVDVALLWPLVLGLFPLSAYTPDPSPASLPYTTRAYLDSHGQRWYELDIPAVMTRLRQAPAKETT